MDGFSDCVKLGDLIAHLEALPQGRHVEHGFDHPHSYRGFYEELAFEPVRNTTVGDMLSAAKSALGRTFEGYKGGNFTMDTNTPCWLATWGSCGYPMTFNPPMVYRLPTAAEPSGGMADDEINRLMFREKPAAGEPLTKG